MSTHRWTDGLGRKWCAVGGADLPPQNVHFIVSKEVGDEILRLADENAVKKGEAVAAGFRAGEENAHDRLRPLLERCEALALAQLHLHQRLPRPDAEAVALFGNLLADLRAELGKDGGE